MTLPLRLRPMRLGSFRAVLGEFEEAGADPVEPDRARHDLGPVYAPWAAFESAPPASAPHGPGRCAPPDKRRVSYLYEELQSEGTERSDRGETDGAATKESLTLPKSLTKAELRRIRRAFAQRHHPDRAPEADKVEAHGLMAAANALIDLAMRKAGDDRFEI